MTQLCRRKVCAFAFGVWGAAAAACDTDDVVLFELPAAQIGSLGGSGGSEGLEQGGTAGNASPTGGTPATGGVGFGGNIPWGESPPSSGGGDGWYVDGEPCRGDDDCPASWFCEMPDCAATEGVCLPRPIFCPPEPKPVCGCDQQSYWNECVRQQAGERSQTFRECTGQARTCDTAADCATSGAFCAKLNPWDGRCDFLDRGTCWVLPEDCSDPMRWIECSSPPPPPSGMPPAPPVCVDTCTAIRSERPHFLGSRRGPCDMPP